MHIPVRKISPIDYSPLLYNRKDCWPQVLRGEQLLVKGLLEQKHLERKNLAIVGTRRPTSYGVRFVREFLAQMAPYEVNILSGGALGIDGEVHKAALRAGLSTQAWVVGPLESPSPRSHCRLFEDIVKSPGGALIVPTAVEPAHPSQVEPHWWLLRNHWLVAAADVLIVIEATENSGTYSSASIGQEFGISTYILPGSIYSAQCQGTNSMLSKGWGTPIASVGFLVQSLVETLNLKPYNCNRGVLQTESTAAGCNEVGRSKCLKVLRKIFSDFESLKAPELFVLGAQEGFKWPELSEGLAELLSSGEINALGDRFERRGYES